MFSFFIIVYRKRRLERVAFFASLSLKEVSVSNKKGRLATPFSRDFSMFIFLRIGRRSGYTKEYFSGYLHLEQPERHLELVSLLVDRRE